jgi:hypothetical protein
MLTIIPERPLEGSKAHEIANVLRDAGCDVRVDEGYACDITSRCATGYKFVIFLWEKDHHRGIVTLSNRWEGTDTNIPQRTFLRNWRSYLEED